MRREPHPAARALFVSVALLGDTLRFLRRLCGCQAELAARNLVLEKQLSVFLERGTRPRRFDDPDRIALALLSDFAAAREAVVVVRPATLLRWRRSLWKLYWRVKSRPRGRPPVPRHIQKLILSISYDNPTWGERRIQDELRIKLGIRVGLHAIRKYRHRDPGRGPGRAVSPERWRSFVRSHAETMLACDFFDVVVKGFRVLHVFVVMELGSRRVLHVDATEHPSARWATQQLREAIPADHSYRFLIHDRHGTFSPDLDRTVRHMGIRVLKTPVRAPRANAFCERLIGTVRRECLDFFWILDRRHLMRILREWVPHYNRGRPHQGLGAIPNPPDGLPVVLEDERHRVPAGFRVVATPVLGGLHHEYRLEKTAA